jgi:hypothetical protein
MLHKAPITGGKQMSSVFITAVLGATRMDFYTVSKLNMFFRQDAILNLCT